MRARGGMANGVFGCAVIGIVILASLGVAFLGNAEERQVDTTDWNYVTSANPAFTYDKASSRVDYSPPANITGYTTDPNGSIYTSGISYVKSTVPTAYLAKTEPIYTSNGTISVSDLASNGLDPVGAQDNSNFSNNKVLPPDVGNNWSSPAYLLKADKLKSAIQSHANITIGQHTILTITSNSDYLLFAVKDAPNYFGVVQQGATKYLYVGKLADKAVVDFDSGVATLYMDGATVTTSTLENLFMGLLGSSDTGLSFSYNTYVWNSEYINPSYGVTPTPTTYAAEPELTDFSALDTSKIYVGFDFDGADVVASVAAELISRYSITVTVGAPCHVSANAQFIGGIMWGVNEFNWTPTAPGTYEFELAEEINEPPYHQITYGGQTYPIETPVRLSITAVDLGTTYWFNGYDNAAVDLLVKPFEGTIAAGGVFISCASSSWTVGGVAVGTWPAVMITYDMDAGVYVTPVTSITNFDVYTLSDSAVVVNTTPTTPIKELAFYVPADVTLSVVGTDVYLAGGGVYRVDSYLDVSAKFPNYSTYNVTISGAAHWGDSITINGTTCAVDKAAGTVEISGETLALSGLVLAYSDSTFYYKGNVYEAGHVVAINDGRAVDLGAAAGLVLEFDGTWYYETALYSGAPGTVSVVDWTPGVLGLDAPAFAAVFTLLSLVGLVLAARLGGGTWDYLVLGSSTLIGFIMCGVFL